MFRSLLIGIAGLCLAGCSYGSAVDIAPFKDRASRPILADGDYCEFVADTGQVRPSEGCVRVEWQATSRLYRLTDLEKDPDEPANADDVMNVAVVPLGSGLYAGQIDTEEGPDTHQISLFVASGDAFAVLPVLQDEKLAALAWKHTRLVWANMPVKGESDPLPLFSKRPWIRSGSLKDVKAFLKEAAREGMRLTTEDDDEKVSVGVRDRDKASDHAASAKQLKDAKAVQKIANKLTPK